jgi:hypothetical protein
LYPLPNIIKATKSMRIKYSGQVAWWGKTRILVEKSDHLEDMGIMWMLKKQYMRAWTGLISLRIGCSCGPEHVNEICSSIKDRKHSEQLSHPHLVKRNSDSWSWLVKQLWLHLHIFCSVVGVEKWHFSWTVALCYGSVEF